MKTIIILAVISVAAAAVVTTPAPVTTTAPTTAPAPGERHGRYLLLQSGRLYDTVYDVILPSRSHYVIQKGAGANRDVYMGTGSVEYRTVPLKEYVVETV